MGLTHFPNGVSSFGVPVLGGGNSIPQTTGTYFFVDDGGSNANDGKDPDHPVATLDYAIGLCTDDHGDVIILMPGHAETGGTTGIAADVAGVQIIGLGYGEAMPTITGHATETDDIINVTADSVVIKNVKFVGGAAGCTSCVDISGDGDFCRLEGCYFLGGAAAPVDVITLATGADDVVIKDCLFQGAGTGLDNFILAEGAVERLKVVGNAFDSIEASGADEAHISFAATGQAGVLIADNYFFTEDADVLVISLSSTTLAEFSGLITHNHAATNDFTTIWGAEPQAHFSFGPNYMIQKASGWADEVRLPAATIIA